MKLNKREQTLLFITIGFMLLFIYYQFLFSPKYEQMSEIGGKLKKARYELETANGKLGSMNYLKQSKIEILPKDVQIEKIVSFLSSNPRIKIISTIPTNAENNIIKIEIICRGKFDDFCSYLNSFKELNLPLQVDSVSMEPFEGMLQIKLVLLSYS